MKNLLYLFIITFSIISCSDKKDELRNEIEKIATTKNASSILNDLYIGSDGDIESLSRILKATPSTINRVRNNESIPTEQFDERIKEVYTYYAQNGQSYSKLRSVLDDEYKWFDTILDFPWNHPYIFWGANLFILFILSFVYFHLYIFLIYVIEFIIFIIAYIASKFITLDIINDQFVDIINPVLEKLI